MHERDARLRIRDDAMHARIGAPRVGRVRRYRDDPRVETTEERRDVLESGRHEQHDAITR